MSVPHNMDYSSTSSWTPQVTNPSNAMLLASSSSSSVQNPIPYVPLPVPDHSIQMLYRPSPLNEAGRLACASNSECTSTYTRMTYSASNTNTVARSSATASIDGAYSQSNYRSTQRSSSPSTLAFRRKVYSRGRSRSIPSPSTSSKKRVSSRSKSRAFRRSSSVSRGKRYFRPNDRPSRRSSSKNEGYSRGNNRFNPRAPSRYAPVFRPKPSSKSRSRSRRARNTRSRSRPRSTAPTKSTFKRRSTSRSHSRSNRPRYESRSRRRSYSRSDDVFSRPFTLCASCARRLKIFNSSSTRPKPRTWYR